MFRRKKLIFCMMSLLGINIFIHASFLSEVNTRRTISLATICAIGVGIYKYGPRIYTAIETQINEMINEEIIQSIILMLTPNYLINQLTVEEREQKFQKKARLMSYKARIIARLEFLLNTQRKTLSSAHANQLEINLNKIKRIFDSLSLIDYGASFFTQNIELDYKESTYIDQIIENYIYTSIILSSKPIEECTEQEKLKRIKSQENIKRLIAKKISCLSEAIILQIDQVISILFTR